MVKLHKFNPKTKLLLIHFMGHRPPYKCSYCDHKMPLEQINLLTKDGIYCEICSIIRLCEEESDLEIVPSPISDFKKERIH